MGRWLSAQFYASNGASVLGAARSLNCDERWDCIVYNNYALLRELTPQYSDLLLIISLAELLRNTLSISEITKQNSTERLLLMR